MDNITHSLVGVALADLAGGRRLPKEQRPLLVGAGIIAANLPDIDLAYSWITPAPIGYLLHHRGHTHTVIGLAGLAATLMLVYWRFPSVRHMRPSARLRFWLLIAVALASHLVLDSLNSYGIHPFYPFDNRWYFGDAVFILEPWLWLILGVAVVWNGRTRTARLAAAMPMVILLATTASMGAVPRESIAAVAIAGGVFAWMALRLSPAMRAGAALAACGLIIAGYAGASRMARDTAIQALGAEVTGRIVDVVVTPNPSSPLCWMTIAIELREATGEYVLWHGTLSLQPEWKAPTACESGRLRPPRDARIMGSGHLALRDEIHQPLQQLRALARNDCWVRAWLRFGRAPVIDRGSIFDLRFGESITRQFSHMRLGSRDGCPPYVPDWGMPRADLLQ